MLHVAASSVQKLGSPLIPAPSGEGSVIIGRGPHFYRNLLDPRKPMEAIFEGKKKKKNTKACNIPTNTGTSPRESAAGLVWATHEEITGPCLYSWGAILSFRFQWPLCTAGHCRDLLKDQKVESRTVSWSPDYPELAKLIQTIAFLKIPFYISWIWLFSVGRVSWKIQTVQCIWGHNLWSAHSCPQPTLYLTRGCKQAIFCFAFNVFTIYMLNILLPMCWLCLVPVWLSNPKRGLDVLSFMCRLNKLWSMRSVLCQGWAWPG